MDAPLIVEYPAGLTAGGFLNFWQRPVTDTGLTGPDQGKGGAPPGRPIFNVALKFSGDVGFFGPDSGKGGKFLLLPPGYGGKVPEGYYVYRSGTNNVFVFLRAFYQDPENLNPARLVD